MDPKFFATQAEWRKWLEKNHARSSELFVGFHKKDSGKPSITWPESVDVALCFGWIDGVRRSVGSESYSIRFTPRKASSNWSIVNIKRVAELTSAGLMHAAGLRAFKERRGERSGVYSFEQAAVAFDDAQVGRFCANKKAWKFFESRPPWYRRTSTWWVISAKRPETREKRLSKLIDCSEQELTIPELTRKIST